MKCPNCDEEMTTGICIKCELVNVKCVNEIRRKRISVLKDIFVVLAPALIALIFFLIIPYVYGYFKTLSK